MTFTFSNFGGNVFKILCFMNLVILKIYFRGLLKKKISNKTVSYTQTE